MSTNLHFGVLISITLGLLSSAWPAAPALASAIVADEAPAADAIEINFAAGVWITRVNGEAALGSGNQHIQLETQLDIDSSEPTFNAELSFTKDNFWRLQLSGFDFSTDHAGTFNGAGQFGTIALNPGDPFRASFDLTSIALELGFWWWQPYCQSDECPVTLTAGPVLGVRWIDMQQSISAGGTRQQGEGEWIVPFAGAQLELRANLPDNVPLLEAFAITGGVSFGPALGGDGGMVTQLGAAITGYVTENFGIGFGYRLIHLDVENDDYEFDGGLQGLFLSAAMRF